MFHMNSILLSPPQCSSLSPLGCIIDRWWSGYSMRDLGPCSPGLEVKQKGTCWFFTPHDRVWYCHRWENKLVTSSLLIKCLHDVSFLSEAGSYFITFWILIPVNLLCSALSLYVLQVTGSTYGGNIHGGRVRTPSYWLRVAYCIVTTLRSVESYRI